MAPRQPGLLQPTFSPASCWRVRKSKWQNNIHDFCNIYLIKQQVLLGALLLYARDRPLIPMEYSPGELATALEHVAVIRSRFRCGHSFIQWPTPLYELQEEDQEWEHHPVCTKSLQLNVDAITTMVAIFHGCFVDIYQLQDEEKRVRILFNMIARLRKEWAWSADSGDHPVASDQGVNVPMPADDDTFFEDDDDGDDTSPIEMPQKKIQRKGAGLYSDQCVDSESPANLKLKEMGIPVEMTTAEELELQKVLQAIADLEEVPTSTQSPSLRKPPSKSRAEGALALPAPAENPDEVDTLPMEAEHTMPSPMVPVGDSEVQSSETTAITPVMQTQKRATKRKGMKKGKKGKKGKKTAKTSAKASKSKPSQTVGNSPIKRLSIMKQHLKKKGSETDATVPAVVSKTSKGKAKPSSKAKARKETKVDESQGETLPPSKKVYQERVKVGKTWRYQILPEQQFGCANCRFIYGGCRTCQNPKFRGKNAKAMREIEALQRSASAGSSASQVAAAMAEPRRKRKAPTHKQKKGAKKPKGLTKSVPKDVD